MKRIISGATVGILSLSVVVACGDDEGTPSPGPSASSSGEASEVMDAGHDAEVMTTEGEPTETTAASSSAMMDAAAGETSATAPASDSTSASDTAATMDSTSDVMTQVTESGDAGPEPDAGPAACEGSALPVDYTVCLDRQSEWCDSEYAAGICASFAFSWDEAPLNTFMDCLTAGFAEEGACEADPYEVMLACVAAAQEVACVTEVEACEVYDGCEPTTVADCNQQAAIYNEQYIDNASVYFECGYEPSAALGD